MTTELVLILGLYAFILMGVFLGDGGLVDTLNTSAPRLAAKIERDIATGRGFSRPGQENAFPNWSEPGR